jgi:hypothetical protein
VEGAKGLVSETCPAIAPPGSPPPAAPATPTATPAGAGPDDGRRALG